MPRLPDHDVQLLKSPNQRVRLYMARFPAFKLQVKTVKRDATGNRKIEKGKWKPVVNIGPNRMCFMGEGLRFDARDSFKYTFSGRNSRNESRQERDTGYGKGRSIDSLKWTFTRHLDGNDDPVSGTTGTVVFTRTGAWDSSFRWVPAQPGLYQVDVEVPALSLDEPVASRWIRVYADRDSMPYSVTAIDGPSAEWGGGSTCGLTFQDENLQIRSTGLPLFAGLAVYAEEFFGNADGGWSCRPMGPCRHDPRLVFMGYAKDGTIAADWQTRTVSVQVESVAGQMERSIAHKLAVWNGEGPDSSDKASDKVDPNLGESQAKRDRKDSDNNTDFWGAILNGFRKVCVTDFVMYMLQFKTNLLRWHDFWGMWTDELADTESIAGEESGVLANMQTVAENDWMVAGADFTNAIVFGPDRQVTRDVVYDPDDPDAVDAQGWEVEWPLVMTLEPEHILELNVRQNLEKNYKFVKLIATKTTDVSTAVDPGTDRNARRRKRARRKARNESQANKKVGTYPNEEPSTEQPGQWFVKQGLLHDSERTMQIRAREVFFYLNLKWAGSVTLPLNRAFRAGDYVRIALNENGLWSMKKFLVKSVSCEIDLQAHTWKTTLEVEEALEGIADWEVTGPLTDPYTERAVA